MGKNNASMSNTSPTEVFLSCKGPVEEATHTGHYIYKESKIGFYLKKHGERYCF